MGFYPVAVVLQKETIHKKRTSQNITHHAETEHSTQNYTNNNGLWWGGPAEICWDGLIRNKKATPFNN
jgi:hypothetical protein